METLKHLEQLFNITLNVNLDSANENCADEEFGNFIQCEITPNPIPNCEPPIIVIYYEHMLVQFFHDATPYPVSVNTAREARDMSMFLNPHPVKPEHLTREDFDSFISELIENYGELED